MHPEQKGFVKGININKANRMIQDVIQYLDDEDDEGIIVFMDQQKTCDGI